MNTVYLFDLASRHAGWTAVRQAVVTGNIANVNTPGYEALDVQPFADVLDKTALTLATTAPGHLGAGPPQGDTTKVAESDSWDIKHSGNSVSLDAELIKAGEVNRAYSLNTSVVRSFHKMIMMSVRTGG